MQDRKLNRQQAAADDDDDDDVLSVSSVSSVSPGDIDDSDDSDDYQGVDEVSDGEDEELMLEKIEEEIILESENERSTFSRLAGSVSGGDEWTGLDDLEHRPFYSAGSFFDDEHLLMQSGGHSDAVDAGLTSEAAKTPVQRRVHFETDDSSDSDKSSDEDDLLPDFLHQDQLDPDLRRMIETDSAPRRTRNPHDLFINSDFCDLPDNIYHVEESENSIGSSSGYECRFLVASFVKQIRPLFFLAPFLFLISFSQY